MAWVQFPFPTCPRCNTSWEVSRHRNCPQHGSIELNPDTRQVRCDGCLAEWGAWRTSFYCSCGHQFEAAEVEAALQEILRAAQMLAQIIERNKADIAAIRRAGDDSLRGWLSSIATGIGGSLGSALGKVIGSVARIIFG